MARRIAVYISLLLLLEYSALRRVFAALPLTYSPILAASGIASISFLAIIVLWKSRSAGILMRGTIGVGFGVFAFIIAFVDAGLRSNALLFESAPDAQQFVTMLTIDERSLKLANGTPCPQCKAKPHIFVVNWSCELPTWLAWSSCGLISLALVGPPLIRTSSRRRRGGCLKCGYDLTGNTSGVCPECGRETGGTDSCKHRTS